MTPATRILVWALVVAVGYPAFADGADTRELFVLGGEALANARYEEALALYTKAEGASATEKSRAAAANGAGRACLGLRKYRDALERLERAVTVDPGIKVAWNNLGVCWMTMYRTGLSGVDALNAAIEAFRKMGELDPEYRPENLQEARGYAAQEAVISGYASTHQNETPRVPAPGGTYATYKAAGDSAEAEGDLSFAMANFARCEAASESAKSKSAAANFQGLLELKKRRDPAAAVEHLGRAVEQDAGNKYAWNNLGVAYRLQFERVPRGDLSERELIEKAVDAFEHMARIDPGYHPENLAEAKGILTGLGAPAKTVSAKPVPPPPPPIPPKGPEVLGEIKRMAIYLSDRILDIGARMKFSLDLDGWVAVGALVLAWLVLRYGEMRRKRYLALVRALRAAVTDGREKTETGESVAPAVMSMLKQYRDYRTTTCDLIAEYRARGGQVGEVAGGVLEERITGGSRGDAVEEALAAEWAGKGRKDSVAVTLYEKTLSGLKGDTKGVVLGLLLEEYRAGNDGELLNAVREELFSLGSLGPEDVAELAESFAARHGSRDSLVRLSDSRLDLMRKVFAAHQRAGGASARVAEVARMVDQVLEEGGQPGAGEMPEMQGEGAAAQLL